MGPVRRWITIPVRRVPCWAEWVYRSVWIEEIGTCHGSLVDASVDGAVNVAIVGFVVDKGVPGSHF